MSLTEKQHLLITLLALLGYVLGRLTVRSLLNLLLGGTLFGGNFL